MIENLSLYRNARKFLERPQNAPEQPIHFRQLHEADLDAVVAIEQAIIAQQPESVRLGHIHAQHPQKYSSLLQDIFGGTSFVGAFVEKNGAQELAGYAANYRAYDPNRLFWKGIDHPHIWHRVSQEPPRSVSLPHLWMMWNRTHDQIMPNRGISFFYSWRVRPGSPAGTGTAICARQIHESLGLEGADLGLFPEPTDCMLSDVTLTNSASLRAQFKAGELAKVETLIWSAGFDIDAENVPALTIMHTRKAERPAALFTVDFQNIMGENFAAFATILDAGRNIAWIDFRDKAPASWQIGIGPRPKHLEEIRCRVEEIPTSMTDIDPLLNAIGARRTGVPNSGKIRRNLFRLTA